MPFNSYGAIPELQIVFNERERDVSIISQIETGKLTGRWRNTGANARAVPTSSSDTAQGDAEGDLMYDNNYLYMCLTISSTLTWCRITLDSSW